MTDSADPPSTNGGDGAQKPAASLADIPLRDTEPGPHAGDRSKPGDLTSMLSSRRRRATGAPADDGVHPEAAEPPPSDSPPASLPRSEPAALAAQGAAVTTLRQRILAEREGRRTNVTAAPTTEIDPETEAESEEGTETEARAGSAAAPAPATTASQAEVPDLPIAEAPEPPSAAGVPPPSGPAGPPPADRGGPDEAETADEVAEAEHKLRTFGRLRRDRRREESDGEDGDSMVSDDLLRKRMAAVRRSESRRREQWEARRGERPEPEETPGPNPGDAASAEPAIAAAPRRPAPQRPGDIARYWSAARRGRTLPALSELGLEEIAAQWPNSVLLRFAPGSRHLEFERTLSRAPGAGQPDAERRIAYTPGVIDWVVHQGLLVARDGNPVRATEEFETERGLARYSVVALPLGEDGETIDHILCHLESA